MPLHHLALASLRKPGTFRALALAAGLLLVGGCATETGSNPTKPVSATLPEGVPAEHADRLRAEVQRLFVKSDAVEISIIAGKGRIGYRLKSTTDNLRPEAAARLSQFGGCRYPKGKPVWVGVRTDPWEVLPAMETCY